MPGDWTIRTATPADEAGINDLLEASYPALMRPAYEAASLDAALPMMTRAIPALLSSGEYFVAETAEGRIVGCGGWSRDRPGRGDVEDGLAHIRHFATRPDWTRKGIGCAIYRTCEDVARAAGMTRFACFASLNAEAFYAALGFVAVRVIELPVGERATLPAVLMEREI